MGLKLITPPTEWPVTLDEAKAQCGVINSDSDGFIEAKIREATVFVERQLSMTIAVRTYELSLDSFTDAVELLRGPVTDVVTVNYVNTDGETRTVSADDYTVDLISNRQWVVINSGTSWPSTLDAINAITIRYTAGYAPDDVPDDLRGAILVQTQLLVERDADPRVSEARRQAVASLMDSHRTVLV